MDSCREDIVRRMGRMLAVVGKQSRPKKAGLVLMWEFGASDKLGCHLVV